MKLRSIIIDDSPLQQTLLAKLIDNNPNLTLSGKYNNALEANRDVINGGVDVMFLDIEMPLLSGFDFLESLEKPPQTILISKKPDYALKAFDYDIAYYLLKPISSANFNLAVKKLITKYELLHSNNGEEEYVFVKSNLKKVKVFIRDIKWVSAIGDYMKIVTENRNIIVLSTMKYFEKILPEDKFLRIHKSYIVNVDRIEQFSNKNVEIDGNVFPLSRNKKDLLLDTMMHQHS